MYELLTMESLLRQTIVLIFLLVTAIQSPVRAQYPTISFISKRKVVDIGDNVELFCSVQYANQYPVHWVKIDKQGNPLFITRGTSLLVSNSRFEVTYQESQSTYRLRINKVREVDEGSYECQIVTGTSKTLRGAAKLFVRIPPVISDNSTRSVITGTGSNISLHCYASGFPSPKISWRREGNELLPNGRGAHFAGNVLAIRNVTKDDRGTYYCVAENGVVPGHRRAIGVEVEFPPRIKIGRQRYGQALQYDSDLSCDIEAFPSSSIIWLKDGEQLSDNQHYRISIFAKSDEFASTTLRVKRIEKRQYGAYICKAINKLGSEEKQIILEETVNVICPPACSPRTSPNSARALSQSNMFTMYGCTILTLVLKTWSRV